MSGPFDAGRDGNVGSGNNFGTQSDIADGQQAALEHGFAQTTGHLSETDYRDADAKP
jgi:hypothetical protein